RDRLDRHGHHEDDQQHQHHVHEGRDVDVAHCAAAAGRKCHGGTPYWPRLGGVVTKPTLRMPWAWAIFTTSLTMRYGVVRSPRMLTVGCGVFCASTDSLLSISWRVAGSSFQNNAPASVTEIVMGGVLGPLSSSGFTTTASGSCTLTLWFISGVVIMKMISSTNITSTRGVTLISAIGPPLSLPALMAMGALRQGLRSINACRPLRRRASRWRRSRAGRARRCRTGCW